MDLYQFHSGPDDQFDRDGLWTLLAKFKQQGKVRHLGISIGSNDNIHQTDAARQIDAEAIQVVYNRLRPQAGDGVFDSCVRQDLGVLARVPLAQGLPVAASTRRPMRTSSLKTRYAVDRTSSSGHARRSKRRRRSKQTEVPTGVPMAQWALAWCLKHPAVTCVIPGCKTVEQVASNAGAADLDMVADDHPQASEAPTKA